MADQPQGTSEHNISIDHQESGDAKKPSDTLDRGQPPAEDDGGRKSSLTSED